MRAYENIHVCAGHSDTKRALCVAEKEAIIDQNHRIQAPAGGGARGSKTSSSNHGSTSSPECEHRV